FWRAAAGLARPDAPGRPPKNAGGRWISFTYPEGQSVQMLYVPADHSLIDVEGFELYNTSPALDDAILAGDPGPLVGFGGTGSPGSPLWWPVGLGFGAVLIVAAIWLQRRLTAART